LNELEVVYLESLWNILSLKRVVLLTQFGQDPFDEISDTYRVKISLNNDENEPIIYDPDDNDHKINDEIITRQILKGKKVANLSNLLNFLHYLYHLVNFKLTINNNNNSDDFNYNLIDVKDIIQQIVEEDDLKQSENTFSFDEYDLKDIKCQNICHLWNLMVTLYKNSAIDQ
jgi:hypothetical protein